MYPDRQWHVKAEEDGEEEEEDEFDDEEGEGRHIPPGPQGGSQASVQAQTENSASIPTLANLYTNKP